MPRAAGETKSGVRHLKRHPAAFLTPSELARYWHLPTPQILDYIRTGQLDALRFGDRLFRIAVGDAIEFARRRAPTRATTRTVAADPRS